MKKVVIKLGGATIEQPGVIEELAADLRNLRDIAVILVHGGGAEIGRYLTLLGKEFTFVDGLRVTDADMVEIVEMVLSGKINKQLALRFQRCGVPALGVSGKDMGLLRARKYLQNGQDIGFVGEIVTVDTRLFDLCAAQGVLPIVSPISFGDDGETYNVNADHAALDVARAVACDDIVFISDVTGIYRANGETIRRLTPSLADTLIAMGEITGGMIPKVRSALECLHSGVQRARIIAWKGEGTLCRELSSPGSLFGTVVTKD
ncbi:MAG: acetylglutamate kinase [candidate division Zixibacteria bacterium]|nr:acetylglutamate kinase [candidate division Zixibacteria bacterium]